MVPRILESAESDFSDLEVEEIFSQMPAKDIEGIKKETYTRIKIEEVSSQPYEESSSLWHSSTDQDADGSGTVKAELSIPVAPFLLRASQNFKPEPGAGFEDDFKSYAASQSLGPGTQQYNKLKVELLSEELTYHMLINASTQDGDGRPLTDGERLLQGYHWMLRMLGKPTTSDSIEYCRLLLHQPPFVNIIDLINASRVGQFPQTFKDFTKFKKYTLKSKNREKIVHLGYAREQPLLAPFLQNFGRGPPPPIEHPEPKPLVDERVGASRQSIKKKKKRTVAKRKFDDLDQTETKRTRLQSLGSILANGRSLDDSNFTTSQRIEDELDRFSESDGDS